MKRVFTLIIVALMMTAFSQSQAQVLLTSGFETWSGAHHPAGWVGVKTNIDTTTGILQYSSAPHAGTYSVQLVNTTTTMKRFTTQPVTISTGTAYEISYWAKGTGLIRWGVTNGNTLYSYGVYDTLVSAPWTFFKDTVYGNADTTAGEFIFAMKSTVAPDHIVLDDVTITALTVAIPEVSIYDIQYTTNVNGNSPQMNNMVKTGGIVTATATGWYVIQSHTGAWNGIEVYDGAHSPALGDSVVVTGQVQEYNGLTEIGNVSAYQVVTTGNPLPVAEEIPTVLVNSENYECVYAKLVNVLVTDTAVGYGQYRVFDGNDTTLVDDVLYHFMPTPGNHYDITGICYYSYSEYKILPRSAADVVLNTSSIKENNSVEVIIYPNPVVNELNLFVNGQAETIRVTDMLGNQVLSQNTNGLNNITINMSNLRTGNYVVSLVNDGQIVARQVIVKQ